MSTPGSGYVVRSELPPDEVLDSISDSKAELLRTKSLQKINEAKSVVSNTINKNAYSRIRSSPKIDISPSSKASTYKKLLQNNPRRVDRQYPRSKLPRITLQPVAEMGSTENLNGHGADLDDGDTSQIPTHDSMNSINGCDQSSRDTPEDKSPANKGSSVLQESRPNSADTLIGSSPAFYDSESSSADADLLLPSSQTQPSADNGQNSGHVFDALFKEDIRTQSYMQETTSADMLPGRLGRRGTTVSGTGSPMRNVNNEETLPAFEESFALADEDGYDDGEDEDGEDYFREIQTRLEKTPRERLIGGMTLRIHPQAHEIIMGYKEGEGPALKPFTNSNLANPTGPKSQVAGRFPPRSSSLNNSPVTPVFGTQAKATPDSQVKSGSVVDRLTRPTAASSSRAAANSTRSVSGTNSVRLGSTSAAIDDKTVTKKVLGFRARMSSYITSKPKILNSYTKIQNEKHDKKREEISVAEKINDSQEDRNSMPADLFNETNIGTFLDTEISLARINLDNARKTAVRIQDAVARDAIIDTIDCNLRLLESIIQIRQANIAANNATFALVRNITSSASSSSRQVLAALRQGRA